MSKETGTAKELDLKPGDVVFDPIANTEHVIRSAEVLEDSALFKGLVKVEMTDFGVGIFDQEQFHIISRASDETPKLWRDMTDEEKGALLLAHHEGKVIETIVGKTWLKLSGSPIWSTGLAYRVKPEPVRETFTHKQWVSMHGNSSGAFSLLFGCAYPEKDVEGQTTIETVDGKPVKVLWEADSGEKEEL